MTQILNLPLIAMDVATSNDADWRMSFAVTDVTDAPVTLVGLSFLLRVWRESGGHEILFVSLPGEITVSGASSNILNVTILATRMLRLEIGEWPFEIIATAEGATMEFVTGTLSHGADGGSIITSISATQRAVGGFAAA